MIFEDESTLCEREQNLCKRRKKCKRYMDNRPEDHSRWIAAYFSEFLQLCDYFIPVEKQHVKVPKTYKK